MITRLKNGAFWRGGKLIGEEAAAGLSKAEGRGKTMAGRILAAHDRGNEPGFRRIRFDSLTSHDITYVGIIQTARASGMTTFPVPYVMTNCHNSLCAVGGTINEDDHVFGLSAAKKYGGIFVPPNQAVIHQFNREMMTGCGKMILGSDSHTRYGAYGTMAVGEGGPELVKQLLGNTYDIADPPVVAVCLTGRVRPGVGPQDVALALIGNLFPDGFVKNKVMEFVGDGIADLSVDFRCGIDVMTTETTCLSSIWPTDDKVKAFYETQGRPGDFRPIAPEEGAYYDGAVLLDLSKVEPMIALPFHPSNAYPIRLFQQNAADILRQTEIECARRLDNPAIRFSLLDKLEKGGFRVGQGIIAGCSGGTFENVMAAAAILDGGSACAGPFGLSVYPASTPVFMSLLENGAAARLTGAGAVLKPAFCGPCFGAGDVPANGALSIRHTTRNFVNREGSKPSGGQIASVALMDARSIAATAKNGGLLTAADEVPAFDSSYRFHGEIYEKCVYNGFGRPQPEEALVFGPNIADWPEMIPMPSHLLLRMAAVIDDPVTTTDELIPSGETSSYRSNPMKLAEFTLSRKEPAYVGRAKDAARVEEARRTGGALPDEWQAALVALLPGAAAGDTGFGSAVYANKPGDGSAREQAASCQRVLGGCANVAREYATKRYRSNLINWGILPLVIQGDFPLENGDFLALAGVRQAVESGADRVEAVGLLSGGRKVPLTLSFGALTEDERRILLEGSLIGYYKAGNR